MIYTYFTSIVFNVQVIQTSSYFDYQDYIRLAWNKSDVYNDENYSTELMAKPNYPITERQVIMKSRSCALNHDLVHTQHNYVHSLHLLNIERGETSIYFWKTQVGLARLKPGTNAWMAW